METRNLDDLHANKKNPRQISKHDFEALKKAIVEFGDLSDIVFNRTTQQLVGGHQRTEAFRRLRGDKKVVLTQSFAEPNKVGTVAVGYVTLDGEFYGYREVEWPLARELAANIAANRIAGEWDLDLLGEANQFLLDNNPDLLAMTGQTDDEINQTIGNVPEPNQPDEDARQSLHLKFIEPQYETVERALQLLKSKQNIQGAGNDDMDANAIYYICQHYLQSNQS